MTLVCPLCLLAAANRTADVRRQYKLNIRRMAELLPSGSMPVVVWRQSNSKCILRQVAKGNRKICDR